MTERSRTRFVVIPRYSTVEAAIAAGLFVLVALCRQPRLGSVRTARCGRNGRPAGVLDMYLGFLQVVFLFTPASLLWGRGSPAIAATDCRGTPVPFWTLDLLGWYRLLYY